MNRMHPCHAVEITTPKKFILNGLWFGAKKPKRAIIFVHGLMGSLFSARRIMEQLVDSRTAVLVFNNRGFGKMNNVKRKIGGKVKSVSAGSAHEVFTESKDDIQGVINFCRKNGVKSIYIAGHSTGCQKAVYWAAKNTAARSVRGIVLLAPISDYATVLKDDKNAKLKKATAYARKLVRKGRKHELLPQSVWPAIDDAQRFLSLYSGEGPEEIFTYWDAKKNPRALKSVKVPLLVLLAEKDEYGDRPAKTIAEWFGKHLRGKHRIAIVPRVPHSFKGGEKAVASAIRDFMK